MIWKFLEKTKTKVRTSLIYANLLYFFSFPEGCKYGSCHVTFLVMQTRPSGRYPAWIYKDEKEYYAGDHGGIETLKTKDKGNGRKG